MELLRENPLPEGTYSQPGAKFPVYAKAVREIVEQAGAELVGIGVAIEKGFQGGGDRLRQAGYDLKSLAVIERADENGIVFRDDVEDEA